MIRREQPRALACVRARRIAEGLSPPQVLTPLELTRLGLATSPACAGLVELELSAECFRRGLRFEWVPEGLKIEPKNISLDQAHPNE